MSCAHPIPLYDKDSLEFISKVPCGKCVNCLVDWRNSIEDRCAEELYQCNYIGAYVTCTYDNYHIDWRDDWHGSLTASLNPNDATKFVKRIRNYIAKYHIDEIPCKKDFRYVVAGEYGEDNTALPRPHFHFIFFGLDYRFCDGIFRKCWKNGFLKILPIKKGCFGYVADYMVKQVKTCTNIKDLYDSYNRTRPFFHHSVGLGATLFKRQWKDIVENNYTYLTSKGIRRPLPAYYMRRYGLYRYFGDGNKVAEWRSLFPNKDFSLKKFNNYKHEIALAREETLKRKLRNKFIPVEIDRDYVDLTPFISSECSETPKEYVQALKQYKAQEVVSNDVVLSIDKDFLSFFIDSEGVFHKSPQFPLYQNIRQVAYDLLKYGSLVPF